MNKPLLYVFVILILVFGVTIISPNITGYTTYYSLENTTEFQLDFTQETNEYNVNVIANSTLSLIFPEQTYNLKIEKITPLVISGMLFKQDEAMQLDIDKDGTYEVVIKLTQTKNNIASLNVFLPQKSGLLQAILNFWWLGILIIIFLVVIFLIRKTEHFRTGNTRRTLRHLAKHHEEGVINEKLYKKAKRVMNRNLKT